MKLFPDQYSDLTRLFNKHKFLSPCVRGFLPWLANRYPFNYSKCPRHHSTHPIFSVLYSGSRGGPEHVAPAHALNINSKCCLPPSFAKLSAHPSSLWCESTCVSVYV
ncbi:hypothetical protein CDAR_247831 [Caerostris darwini]|uniref:Uncharacterized protein n=1 Tax=Caerostris darwini TaxID=1538125 RepID=A0AAV4W1Q5_9ARAC|nr:hypothetical protein CDAR_247831 [Caerostris darwini]